VPLKETVEAFQELQDAGKILEHGVSNFDVSDMEEWVAVAGGDEVATNQVLYSLLYRGIEWRLVPWSRVRHIPLMAYSPVGHKTDDQKRLFNDRNLKSIAAAHGVTPAQVALAWVMREPDVIAIPKASRPEHIRENRATLDIEFTDEDLAKLDQSFPAPTRKTPLETL
jgi:diketogulonate reductase-like aldo/keto reductase